MRFAIAVLNPTRRVWAITFFLDKLPHCHTVRTEVHFRSKYFPTTLLGKASGSISGRPTLFICRFFSSCSVSSSMFPISSVFRPRDPVVACGACWLNFLGPLEWFEAQAWPSSRSATKESGTRSIPLTPVSSKRTRLLISTREAFLCEMGSKWIYTDSHKIDIQLQLT